MDKVTIPLEDKSFTVELSKEQRVFGYSEFGNYICKLRFLDTIGIPHLEIKGTEKQFYDFMNLLNDINNDPYSPILDDVITYFSTGETFMFIYVTTPKFDYPCDDDDRVTMSIFEDTMQGRMTRMYVEFSFLYLEELIYAFYQLLGDIPYLDNMGYSLLLDIMGEYNPSNGYYPPW